jgi:serine/threonine protein kinase
MAAARKKLIDEIFLTAADMSPEEASRYVETACNGDAALIAEVEALLSSDRLSQGNIGMVVMEAAGRFTGDRTQDLRKKWIGRRIGQYSIVGEIGRGGMGAVYRAVRADDQYRRAVAVKVIAQGFLTPEALARFRTERQILATLQHPNIAALLDGGETEDGAPYIVLEYIEGEPLLDYCRNRKLGVPHRLELFRALCSAVQHAHQLLVIHRDIKPGNVLVTNDGVPKLLDFGIAKLLTTDVIPGAITNTRTVQRVLTPQYASPEQIRGEQLTTASDVYSLGVLLYELLTSSSPYRTTGKAPVDLGRIVCESHPLRLTAAPIQDARLRRQLSGDLENIVAMALRKEPERRYQSVQQFSDDIGRFLQGLPVSAREDTLLYVVSKLVKRNKLATAAFALLAISIVIGWLTAINEHRRTEERFQEVRKLANTMLFDLSRDIESLPGSTQVREKLVRTGLDYLSRLSTQSEDLSLLWDVSQGYERIGDVQGDPDGPNLGLTRDALNSYRKAMTLVQTVVRQRRDYETLSCLVWLHYKCGDLESRVAGATRAIDDYNKGLEVAAAMGRELSHERTDELLRQGFQRLSMAQMQAGLRKGAIESAQKATEAAVRTAAARPGSGSEATVARTVVQLGNVLWLQGDLNHAAERFETAIATYERLLKESPGDNTLLQDLADAYRRAGDLRGNPAQFHFGDPKMAEQYHRKSLQIAERFVLRDPRDAKAQSRYAVGLRRLGAVTRGTKPHEAVDYYSRAIEISGALLRESPGDLATQRDIANHRCGLAYALLNMRQYEAARQQAQAAVDMQRAILKISPDNVTVREDMVDSQIATGEVWLAQKNPKAAMPHFSEALWTARMLAEKDKDSLYTQRCHALASKWLGDCYAALGDTAEASKSYGEALKVWSRWKRENLAMPYAGSREADVLAAAGKLPRAGR